MVQSKMTSLRTHCRCEGSEERSTECACSGRTRRTFQTHLDQSRWREEVLDNRRMLVVPLVMAKANVVMNNGLLTVDEFTPHNWNGVPVTVGHPVTPDGFVSASESPKTHEEWVVGRVFGARVEGLDLKAEAWIDIEKAESRYPDLVSALKNPKTNMNVSTGFFSKDFPEPGTMGGRPYEVVSRDIRPNHLALLPDEKGACSWEDGCGVRTHHKKELEMTKTSIKDGLEALRAALGDEGKGLFNSVSRLVTNERGNDDDHRQIVADLISNDGSPFVPDDEDSLRMMSRDTLRKMRDAYIAKKANEETEEETEDLEANEETEEETEDLEANEETEEEIEKIAANAAARGASRKRGSMKPRTLTVSQLRDLVSNTAKAAAKQAIDSVLTPENRAALKLANNAATAEKNRLIEQIAANSDLGRDWLKAQSHATLETLAKGVSTRPDYSGRRMSVNSEELSRDKSVVDMTPASSFVANKALQRAN